LRDNSKRKTRVRFVYVLPEVLHGDFLSEIRYLVNLDSRKASVTGELKVKSESRDFRFIFDEK